MPRQGKLFKKRKTVGWQNSKNQATSNITSGGRHRPSTAKVKLDTSNAEYGQFESESFQYDIINLSLLDKIISEIAVCKDCFGPLKLCTKNRVGLSCSIVLKCMNPVCEKEVVEKNSALSKITIEGKKYSVRDVNARFVYAMRSIGVGQQTAQIFAGVMNFPQPSKFAKYNNLLQLVTKMVCTESMKDAVEIAVRENDGSRDIACAFDGTWQRRGFSSLNGVLTATSITTGLVIDVEIMSKYCTCKDRFQNEHSGNCISNYTGTSGGMEVEGVRKLFARSQEMHGIRYKHYLGDGDCKGFDTVCEDKPYGPEFKVEKLECVGHVQKRMGKRLRTYKLQHSKKLLKDKKTLGGRGRLTGAAIDAVQLYYGLAIRRNASEGVEAMKRAIWAEYFHLGSTDERPEHALCPTDNDTWCKYQKAKTDKTVYKHSDHFHLPTAVLQEIKPIFKDLSNPILLSKCCHGGTQNMSESLNNVIWSRIPKRVFVRLNTLKLGVYDAIAHYNKGYISKCLVFKIMGLNPGKNCMKAMKKFDAIRVKKAEIALQEIQKKCRREISLKRRQQEDTFEENEDPDKPSYSCGHY